MTDITGIVNLALLVGVIGVVISLLGKVERIATALEELAEDRRRAPADDGSSHRSEPDAGCEPPGRAALRPGGDARPPAV
ncbi:hypothetical protein WDZ16_01505 [Pseudokineococcus marinus]|uniref:Uncharacterized protein n=1 Tax=Pseudokineococcus marinus TaxID=351215 RepID=A0A849BH22_9ACTN|nr:hypothetical protein [Pseudokineococcus marinus]NNH22409.1 hypothetical protein [Pseudokineococcus marinus]